MSQTRLHFLSARPTARRLSPSENSELDSRVFGRMDDTQTPTPPPRPQTVVSAAFSPKAKLPTSWIYDHMPDEDQEPRYYNKTTPAPEWRRRYCAQTYALSVSTDINTKHLRS
jgi:hypothetical protein